MRLRTVVFALVGGLISLALLTVPLSPVVATAPREHHEIIDIESECSSLDTLVPQDYEAPLVGDYEKEVVLDVHVLMVGVDLEGAKKVMEQASTVYTPIGIRLSVTYESVDLKIDPKVDNSAMGQVISSSESRAYIQASKDHLGGQRPWFADVVYTMVGGELASSVAGQADCVGGIVYPDAAFAVGETDTSDDRYVRRSAVIAAHEIAHLLAAHHHFANCAEGNKEETVRYGQPCTLMFNDLFFISLGFSTLEAAVVRAYALEYADATPTSPPPPPPPSPTPDPSGTPDETSPESPSIERSISLTIGERWRAKGAVDATGAGSTACRSNVAVILERRNASGAWVEKEVTYSDEDGRFLFRLSHRGTYRAKVDPSYTPEREHCPAATSPPAKTPRPGR